MKIILGFRRVSRPTGVNVGARLQWQRWVAFDRREALRRLADETFDVLIIGGGITGAGCALDAATRGLRVALVEARDFASGTSSKSSKLVHGGLRYLQNGELGLVYEALAERQILTNNAPHLVHMLPFLLPIFRDGGFIDRRLGRGLGLAMWGYDLTGGFRYGKLHERLSKSEALARFPTLDAIATRLRLRVLRRNGRRCPADAVDRSHRGLPWCRRRQLRAGAVAHARSATAASSVQPSLPTAPRSTFVPVW